MKRKPDESFEDYKRRRMVDNIISKIKQVPKLVWNSRAVDTKGNVIGRTFIRGRDTLTNSRADSNKVERLRRDEEGRRLHQERMKGKPTPEHPDTEIWQQELPLGETDA
jgi:hypothetical protein